MLTDIQLINQKDKKHMIHKLYKIEDFQFNQKIVKKLDNIIRTVKTTDKFNEIPNILFYGLPGSGKKSLVNYFIFNLFDCEKLDNHLMFKTELMEIEINKYKYQFIYSNYFLIIHSLCTPSDKNIIQQIIKMYVSKQTIDNKIKFIIIEDVDSLTFYAQMSLRRTMEIYNKECKFILLSKSNNIINPLISRCINFRVPRPTNEELYKVCERYKNNFKIEKKEFNREKINEIIEKSNNNITELLINLNNYFYGFKEDDKIDKIYNDITENLLSNEMLNFGIIRNNILELIKLNIDGTEIINNIILNLDKKIRSFISFDENKIKDIYEIKNKILKNFKNIKNQIIFFDILILKLLFILY